MADHKIVPLKKRDDETLAASVKTITAALDVEGLPEVAREALFRDLDAHKDEQSRRIKELAKESEAVLGTAREAFVKQVHGETGLKPDAYSFAVVDQATYAERIGKATADIDPLAVKITDSLPELGITLPVGMAIKIAKAPSGPIVGLSAQLTERYAAALAAMAEEATVAIDQAIIATHWKPGGSGGSRNKIRVTTFDKSALTTQLEASCFRIGSTRADSIGGIDQAVDHKPEDAVNAILRVGQTGFAAKYRQTASAAGHAGQQSWPKMLQRIADAFPKSFAFDYISTESRVAEANGDKPDTGPHDDQPVPAKKAEKEKEKQADQPKAETGNRRK
jgi:hypothetical protein